MKTLGYYNGKYDELEKMNIPMLDRVSFFGDGIYDATYSRNYVIHDLDLHVDRFFSSAQLLDMKPDLTKQELKDLLNEMVKKLDSPNQFVYFQLTRGTGIRRHAFPDAQKVKPNLWIVLTPSEIADTYKKVKLITKEDTRFHHCNIKTVNLLPACMASNEAEMQGAQECVFHRGDEVTECAHSNVHIIKDNVFITHPTDCFILPGIARRNLIEKCKQLKIEVHQRAFTLNELMNADEVIISSAGSFCISAEMIDGKPVGGKAPEILKKLQDSLMQDFYEECGE